MDPAASQIQTNYLVKQLEAANRSSPKIQTPDPSCHAFQNILAPSRQDEHHLSIQPFSTIPQPVTPIAPDQIYARITQLLQPLSLAQHGAMLTQLNAHYSARRDLHPGSPINPDGAPALTQKMHELGKAIESVDAWSKANNRLLHESLRAVSAAAAVQGEEGKEAKKNGE